MLTTLTPRVKIVKDEEVDIDVTWRDSKLGRDAADERRAQRRWGALWPMLRRRLAMLRGTPTLADLHNAPGNCHELGGNRAGQLAVRLTGNMRLVFTPNHEPSPTKPDGGLIWEDITKVKIEEVVDYHDD